MRAQSAEDARLRKPVLTQAELVAEECQVGQTTVAIVETGPDSAHQEHRAYQGDFLSTDEELMKLEFGLEVAGWWPESAWGLLYAQGPRTLTRQEPR